jgi:hypothetical protein
MPTKVNLPDGRVVNFPDTMTQEQILTEVEKLSGPAPTATTSGPQMRAYTARTQSEEDPWGYTKKFLGNILPSAGRAGRDTVLGVLALGKQAASAPVQVVQAAISDDKTLADVELGQTLRNLPGAVVQTYRDRWADDEDRARNIRDDPFGMASDGAALVSGIGATRNLARAGVRNVAAAAAPVARRGAERAVVKAFEATSGKTKAMAEKATPAMLDQGVRPQTIGRLATSADEQVSTLGQRLDAAYQTHGPVSVDTKPILDEIQVAKQRALATTPSGSTVPIAGSALPMLESLEETIRSLGPTTTVENLRKVKQAWDEIAYAKGPAATDNVRAGAFRVGADATRRTMANAVTELDDLNRQYSHHRNVADAAQATVNRQSHQGLRLRDLLVSGTGGGIGTLLGGTALGGGVGATLAGGAYRFGTSTPGRLLRGRVLNDTSRGLRALVNAPAMSGPAISIGPVDSALLAELLARQQAIQGEAGR